MNKIYVEGVWESAMVAVSTATLCTQASLSKGSEPLPVIPLVYLQEKENYTQTVMNLRKKKNLNPLIPAMAHMYMLCPLWF